MILVCQEGNLTKQVQKLKSISSKLFHRHEKISDEKTSLHKNKLWSQKFYRASLDEWKLSGLSNTTGLLYNSSYLSHAMTYVKHNRDKHGLNKSKKLENIIDSFLTDINEAYGISL